MAVGGARKVTALIACWVLFCGARAEDAAAPLPPPKFHHLMLNATDPDAAIAFYVKEFPGTSRTTWEGMPALASPDNVLILFHKVARPPPADPLATAYWHFGWAVTDSRLSLDGFKQQPGLLVPFYTDDKGGSVFISSDTYPYPPGVPGRTKAQLAEAETQGLKPRGIGGNGYIAGPDNALIEFTGNAAAMRFDHVHMWQEEPLCAQLWYEKHLGATPRRLAPGAAPPTETDCKIARGPDPSWPSLAPQGTYRTPTGGVSFGDVALNWYMRQTAIPLAATQGRLMDNIGLGVTDLNAWIAKLRREKVVFLRRSFRLGNSRAVTIEGPSHEAIELIEVK